VLFILVCYVIDGYIVSDLNRNNNLDEIHMEYFQIVCEFMLKYLTDDYLYPITQYLIVSFFLFASIKHWIHNKTNKKVGFVTFIKRSDASMKIFYSVFTFIFGAITFVFSLNYQTKYSLLLFMLNTAIAVYLILLNPWIRSKLLQYNERLTTE